MSFYFVVSLLCIAIGTQVQAKICPAVACECADLFSVEYFNNVNGCRQCRCQPYNPCAATLCPVGTTCQVVNGKAVCQCNPLPFACVYCPNGYVTDANGCRTCQCRTIECPLRKCVPCPNDYVIDSNGCQTCECITTTTSTTTTTTTATTKPVTACPMFACNLACAYGYLNNANGCPICRCAPRNPNPLR